MSHGGYPLDADDLIRRLFAAQNALDPDSDPGDLTIEVQDDFPMVAASQGRDDVPADRLYGESTWVGGSVIGVLNMMVEYYESLVSKRSSTEGSPS